MILKCVLFIAMLYLLQECSNEIEIVFRGSGQDKGRGQGFSLKSPSLRGPRGRGRPPCGSYLSLPSLSNAKLHGYCREVETRSAYGTAEGTAVFRLSNVKEHAKAQCHQRAIGRLTSNLSRCPSLSLTHRIDRPLFCHSSASGL